MLKSPLLWLGVVVICFVAAAAAAAAAVVASPAAAVDAKKEKQDRLLVTLTYCPTYFTGKGAIVEVDPNTGDWEIVHDFFWPSGISDSCPFLYSPIVHHDKQSGNLLLQFNEIWGLVMHLNLETGEILHQVEPDDIFFHGYVNYGFENQAALVGVTPTVTERGFCSNGCFGYGTMDPIYGNYTKHQEIPFKAALNMAHYHDVNKNSYYLQMSYDLRDEICGKSVSDQCLVELDTVTGSVKSTLGPMDYTPYKYGDHYLDGNGTVLTFSAGFKEECDHSSYSYAFAKMNLKTLEAVPTGCFPDRFVIHEQPWISSFSSDHQLLATGSGNIYGHAPQVAVFDTNSGDVLIDSDLVGLAEKVKLKYDYFVSSATLIL